jgi:SET domain-containing protein
MSDILATTITGVLFGRRGSATMKARHSWLSQKLEVRISPIHENGVFARETVPAGERVAILGGDVMFIEEISHLPEHLQNHTMQIEERFVLGSRSDTDDTDFFNHSCDPNAGFKGQIFLVAMRPILAGEEVTFDYAMVVSESVGSDIVFQMNCRCGATTCRRVITENDWKRADLRRRYHGYFSEYLQEKIEAESR